MQTGAVFFFSLLDRENLAAEVRKLDEFLLDFLEAFLSLAVSDLGFGVVAAAKAILLIQLLNVGDLVAKTPNFFTKNIQMIHAT